MPTEIPPEEQLALLQLLQRNLRADNEQQEQKAGLFQMEDKLKEFPDVPGDADTSSS